MHGPIPPHRYFAYLTWTDIAAMPDRANVVIVQPMGAIEQHGPHLPLAVDSAICTTVLGNALAQLDDAVPVYSLPPLYYGKSNEHWHFPGTITLSAETLMKVIYDVAKSIYRAGFRKLVLLNAHGGQPQVLEVAARDLHQVHSDLMVFPLFVWAVPNCAGDLLTPKEMELGIHAGDAETSLMLSIMPEQVRMAEAKAEFPQNLPTDSWLTMEGALPFAWVTRDLSASGVLGDPTVATEEKGEQILTSLATSWATALEDIYRFRQPHTDPACLP
ncbi:MULTISPECIES: creatininase family protein [Cyanophyceae]|uniref:creatininase family protein n=1 Tax=Cyanophyceae TaxID=3028117 RepID=UPI0016873A3E|nr:MULTISPECIES: creatininase family protein [Cyanophyceae]MBD1914347.1 creatininase family protein [Phormidium sp. FACHB-77]MBD2028669.1 creatininase family protein [Phormidium sp. FACHB-322]MBD2053637.1 creatininase family protein [Leptolyngbya sp. FACHB-60]